MASVGSKSRLARVTQPSSDSMRDRASSHPALDRGVIGPILALFPTQEARVAFLRTCVGALARLGVELEFAVGRDDRVELARVAHAIRGSALAIGGTTLAAEAAVLEERATTSEVARVLAAGTGDACEKALDALEEELATSSTARRRAR